MSTLLELPDPIDLTAVSDKRTWTVDPKTKAHLYGVYESSRSRDAEHITGIVLHQTACFMGEKPSRYLSTGAHRVVTRGGLQLKLHEVVDRIVSANGFDARCVSIECDGLYAGDDTTPQRALATTWDDPTTKVREQPMAITSEQVVATLATIDDIIADVAGRGGRIKFLFAHRQSSDTRESDPGRAHWQQIAMPAIAKHDLNKPENGFDPKTFVVGSGRAIPECWNPAYKGNRY